MLYLSLFFLFTVPLPHQLHSDGGLRLRPGGQPHVLRRPHLEAKAEGESITIFRQAEAVFPH